MKPTITTNKQRRALCAPLASFATKLQSFNNFCHVELSRSMKLVPYIITSPADIRNIPILHQRNQHLQSWKHTLSFVEIASHTKELSANNEALSVSIRKIPYLHRSTIHQQSWKCTHAALKLPFTMEKSPSTSLKPMTHNT